MKRIYLLLIMLSAICSSSFAQILKPVTWKMDFKHINNDEFELIYTATIKDGWTIYSQFLESDDGPVATTFEFDGGSHFKLNGKTTEDELNRKSGHDKIFDMNVTKYSKKAIFRQKVKASDLSKPITGYLTFMTCDATKCLPPTDVDFEFALKKQGGEKTGQVEEKLELKKEPAKPKKQSAPPIKITTRDNSTGTPYAQPKLKIEPKPGSGGQGQEITIGQPKIASASNSTPSKKTTASTNTKAEEKPAAKSDGLLKPVTWDIGLAKTNKGETVVNFTANIKKGWTIYSQHTSDEGPVPTSFEFDKGDHYSLVGSTSEDGKKKEGYDKLFDTNVIKFVKGPVTFQQIIKSNNPTQAVSGYLTFMTCDESRCLPPADVDFVIMPGEGKAMIGDEATDIIASLSAGEAGGGTPSLGNETKSAGTFSGLNINGNEIDQVRPIVRETYETPVGDCGKEDIASGGLLWTFILGFLGGLLALLTPCVFPMIPLTVSYFTKGSTDRMSGIKNGLIYGASIIVIYLAIGLLITSVFGPTALNALSTNWIANTLFFLIFLFFAFSFFGFYEITLPSSWSNKSDTMADKGGLLGTFFMAFTLALVSFSCTGPIIGSALVASAKDALGPFIVMLGFSSALALPFGLFAAFPAMLNTLPKSGSWMNSVKVVLGFLELALAFKFLSVADMTMHWGILGYEVFMGLWILIFAGMTLYLFGFIKFPHDSPLKKLSIPRWGFALASLALTIYLCTGFTMNKKTEAYNSLGLMSGLAPPAYYNYFLPEPTIDQEIKKQYPSFTKCANNLDCFKDYYEGFEYANKVNKPVLLDFTGFGCVNCRKTEEHIWVVEKVWQKIAEDYVLVSLYVDDRKKLEQQLLSKSRNEKLRTVGSKWADFQIVNFEQNSQPLYVMMAPDERVLAKPRGYKEGADDYAEFLNCGLKVFEEIKDDKSMLGSVE